MFSECFQVSTLVQCLCSINAVKYLARVTFRGGLHNVKKRIHTFQNGGHKLLDISVVISVVGCRCRGCRYFWETVISAFVTFREPFL